MSLQIWLPFNGTDKNQGLYNDLIYTGDTIYNDNGKIGKCKSGGLSIKADKNPMELEGTIAFWIYVDENATTGLFFGNNPTTVGTDNRKWSLFLYPNRNSIHSWGCMLDDSTSSGNGSFTINNIIPDETWTHIAISHDNTNQYIYVNGELNQTIKWNNLTGTLTFDAETQIIYQNNGVLFNDFRIYDECLNKKQIKELAKGLVAHYKLSRPMPNIVKGTYDMSGISGSGSILSEKYNGYVVKYKKHDNPDVTMVDTCYVGSFLTPKANTYYTCSFWAKGTAEIHNFFYPSCCANVNNSYGYAGSVQDGNNVIKLTNEWKKYWIIYRTLPNVTGTKSFIVGRIEGTSNLGKDCYIAGIKFEEGYNKCPTWSPHPDDVEYYTYGYNTNIEKDVSGNGYDLEYSKLYPEINNDGVFIDNNLLLLEVSTP